MCGRFRDTRPWAELHAALTEFVGPFEQAALNIELREQVRPTQAATIVRLIDDAASVSSARWWLIPWFHKGTVRERKATRSPSAAIEQSRTKSVGMMALHPR
jgi:putative SOS response-associated peptidase YedK